MTTLNQIRVHSPSTESYAKLLKHLNKTSADDEPLSLLTVLDSNGLEDAIWCLRTEATPERIQRFALAVVRRVQHLSPDAKACNDVTERYIAGQATREEIQVAILAAYNAAENAETGAEQAVATAAGATAEAAILPKHAAGYLVKIEAIAEDAADAVLSAASYDEEAYYKERKAQAKIFKGIFA